MPQRQQGDGGRPGVWVTTMARQAGTRARAEELFRESERLLRGGGAVDAWQLYEGATLGPHWARAGDARAAASANTNRGLSGAGAGAADPAACNNDRAAREDREDPGDRDDRGGRVPDTDSWISVGFEPADRVRPRTRRLVSVQEEAPRRTCPRCGLSYPLNNRYFYIRPSGRPEYCLTCHREYYKARADVRRALRPRELRFGVELEFSGATTADVARSVAGARVRCRALDYTHAVTRYWKVIPDGSIGHGGELVSPPLRMNDRAEEEMARVCRAAREAGAAASRACGLHVHLEVRGYDAAKIGRIFRMWYNNQGLLDEAVSASRRDGRWCRRLSEDDVLRVEGVRAESDTAEQMALRMRLARLDRYRNLNGTCYPRYGTLEVRSHQGTLAPDKVMAWARLCRALFTMAAAGDDAGRASLDELLDAAREHGLPDADATFMRRRARELARRARPAPAPAPEADGATADVVVVDEVVSEQVREQVRAMVEEDMRAQLEGYHVLTGTRS